MAYYLRQIADDNATDNANDLGPYETRSSAYGAIPAERRSELRIVFVASDIERAEWSERERSRFADGTYREVPWSAVDSFPLHFAHLSANEPGMIAYTADDEAGVLNRKLRVRPGRYLEKFYGSVDLATRQTWIALCAEVAEPLQFATTADDIERVFRNGPISCMGPDVIEPCDQYPNGRRQNWHVHPTRVYGGSDLSVAYLGPIDKALARAVVWQAEKTYPICYPNWSGCGPYGARLENALIQAGYQRGSFNGAKIRAIEHPHGGWVMPYVDGGGYGSLSADGRWIVIGRGDIDTQTTSGQVENPDDEADDSAQCDHCSDWYPADDLYRDLCESCRDMQHSCGNCDTTYFADSSDDNGYCESCENDRQYCESCESDYFSGGCYALSLDSHVCDDCSTTADGSRFVCESCESDDSEWDYSRRNQIAREATGHARRFCAKCSESITICHVCNHGNELIDGIDHVACGNCGIAPRCPFTLDLFATVPAQPVPPSDATDHDSAMEALAERLTADDSAVSWPAAIDHDSRMFEPDNPLPVPAEVPVPVPYVCGCTVCSGGPADDSQIGGTL